MKARLLFRDRYLYDDGAIPGAHDLGSSRAGAVSRHRLKYSLFYGYPGKRVIGYDNERGKGDHKHLGDQQQDYRFISIEQLVGDFLADVRRERER